MLTAGQQPFKGWTTVLPSEPQLPQNTLNEITTVMSVQFSWIHSLWLHALAYLLLVFTGCLATSW